MLLFAAPRYAFLTDCRQVLDKRATLELKAFVSDAYGLYYLRRGKSSAALDYVQTVSYTHLTLPTKA